VATTKSARSADVMLASAEALSDDAMIVIIDTIATATISPAAVAEVRAGLRRALRSPSVPTGPLRASGTPSTRQTGRTANVLSTATPMNTAAAPMPTSSTLSPV
jgi:hypothetical protein